DASQPKPEPVGVAALIGTRADAWADELAARGIGMAARVPNGVAVLATPGTLEQVLDNLISNALHAMEPGGHLTLAAARAGGRVELHVRDTGPGMTAEQRSRALDRFWRASSAGTGTGLGLAIVHRLVTADGGTVDLRDAEGGGLDVVVALRGAPERPARSPAEAARAGAAL